ncbi:hypothetical protein F5X68DRAFT_201828 [Plectosphaerella plurivora]|uniref:Uncharacterized protein n=1 Tax=Plectosphaerella plurivora TaxID=936078 RepID=A0A9P8VFA3_9PEZI|nr:hypothetical protein F5X68DRAFT_201828 [Plectosphaerella plurivora]
MIQPWFNEQEDVDVLWSWQTDALRSLEKGKRRYLLRLETVVIHTSATESARYGDGLFGRLGDAPVALVDPLQDWEDIERARRLWKATGQCGSDTAYFFRRAEHLREELDEWWGLLENAWVRYRRANDSGTEYSLRELWGRSEGVYMTSGDLREGRFGTLRRNHPWVKKQLSRMPEFRGVIMFRHCSDACHLEEGDPRETRQSCIRQRRALRAGQKGKKDSQPRAWYPPRVLLPPEMSRGDQ